MLLTRLCLCIICTARPARIRIKQRMMEAEQIDSASEEKMRRVAKALYQQQKTFCVLRRSQPFQSWPTAVSDRCKRLKSD